MTPGRQIGRWKKTSPGGVVVPFPDSRRRRGYNDRCMRPMAEPSRQPSGPFRLGRWTVRPERNLLEFPDANQHLEPKAMDALVLLVDRGGEVVTKDDFIDEVWEGRIISEGTLTNTIAELRGALGDDARKPSFIETIPKRGYRLICPVEELPAGEISSAEETGGSGWRWIAMAVVAMVACVGVITVFVRSRSRPLDPEVVLVSPFANRTGDETLAPLTTLARDRIVSLLSGSGLARPVTAGVDSAPADLDVLCDLARVEGAGLALTGALYLHEGEIEVQAQLVDVAEGALLYAVPAVSGPREHAADSLEEAVQRVLGALATHLHAHAHSSLLSRPPVFAAYREFMAGSELFGRDMAGAIRHLKTATEIDPDFTSAQFRLAMALRAVRRAEEGRAILEGLEGRRGELTNFERLWLDAFTAGFDGRWAESLAALNGIKKLAPSDWTVIHLISIRELDLNRPRRAAAAIEQLHAMDLHDFITRHPLFKNSFRHLAQARHMVGNHEAELAAARSGRTRFPTDHSLMVWEAKALTALGDMEGLEALVLDAQSTPMPLTATNLLVEAAATARAHDRPQLARELAERAVEDLDWTDGPPANPEESFLLAEALVYMGQIDRAQAVLEGLVPQLSERRGYLPVAARGWLGSVAARRGDLETARTMDLELAGIEDPYLYGSPVYYRAAIAAWLGHRQEAIEFIWAARAEGWSAFFVLHDEERVLFEPLEGMAEYEEMLHPTG